MFRAKPLCHELPPLLTPDEGSSLETSIFCVCTANLKSLLKQVWNKILTTVTVLMGTSDLLRGCPKKTDTVMIYNTALCCQLFENRTGSAVRRRAGAGVLTYFAGAGVCSPPVKL